MFNGQAQIYVFNQNHACHLPVLHFPPAQKTLHCPQLIREDISFQIHHPVTPITQFPFPFPRPNILRHFLATRIVPSYKPGSSRPMLGNRRPA